MKRVGLSALSAAMMVLSVPRFDLWPLMWVALLPALHVALGSRGPRQAFWQGWLTGTLANTAAFWWMRGLLERFGHMPELEALPIMLLLTAYQGLEFGLWSWAVAHLARRRPTLRMAWLAPMVMVAIELVVPQIFPYYLAISQAWVLPVIQIADVTGPMGVSFLLVMCSGALHDALASAAAAAARARLPESRSILGAEDRLRGPRRRLLAAVAPVAGRALAIPALVVVAVLGYGLVRRHQIEERRRAAPHARVGIVQANVGIQEKWDPAESTRLLELHRRESAALVARGAELLVWPETSYPFTLPRDFAADYPPSDPRRIAPAVPTPMLFGAVTLAPPGPATGKDRFPYNSAFMLDAGGRVTGRYDKIFLLLFGEYIPFYDAIPWFTRVFPEASNFSRGETTTTLPFRLRDRTYGLGPLICYEDILAPFTRRVAARHPNLLVNITNDAWFGKTAEPYQHLALSVFRSVEHRLDMVRAVNTGVSAHIDATGRVRESAGAVDPDPPPRSPTSAGAPPPAGPSSLLVEVALLDAGGLYVHVGDLFAVLCCAALVGLGLRSRRAAGARGGEVRARAGRRDS